MNDTTYLFDEYDIWFFRGCKDYTRHIISFHNEFSMDIFDIGFLGNIKDIRLFIEKLVQRLLISCKNDCAQKRNYEKILENIIIPFFFTEMFKTFSLLMWNKSENA